MAKIFSDIVLHPRKLLWNLNKRNFSKFIYYFRTTDPTVLEEKVRRKISETSILTSDLKGKTKSIKNIKLEEVEFLEFPRFQQPVVSVIIPVWNKWEYTYNCLCSLLKYTDKVPYEIIIVNNASDDETPQMLAKVRNIWVINNETNFGFTEACNIGAKASTGEFLLFLNNDTEVRKGWLSAMINLAKIDKSIGLIGGKLIYPDGKLQEAGGIVWNDPENLAFIYGKYDDPNKWEYNFVKEVDYCSGACILVRKDLFKKVGLFDTRFAPAYFEDTDLAFRIRELGYKVMYQPKAEIIHFEGLSAGTDTLQGVKKYQIVNQNKFYDKWRSVLENGHFPSGKEIFSAQDRSKGKKVILFIDHYIPHYDKDAGSFITFEYLKIFIGMGFKV
ncbi:MAG: glycosyltransferase family 2 protein, partial [Deltaproteobacteria bacterium]|nr:glycosyltransferase family 2 protein [Deltaproteobacteria bacterium]